jgi:S-DNA-T family DNA segregation ATPase FtsK/SpoIIIE
VVTEPAKAVRALKWAVEEMERRYRQMSEISVRNLTGFNEKVRAAQAKGKPLGRRIQIGFDPDSGEELFEEQQLDYQPLPQIVVIVDELADLMVTVGKEIEVLIQRLSQKSRAAGIHLIMATQRPSVDVITGVIKANLPTRISFAVTSRIDSRTILGEQGAEQLLGKGDMLYKPSSDPVKRVHGPFVSDEEVEMIADFWRGQGSPEYVDSVTEEPEDGGFGFDDLDATASDNPGRAQVSPGLPDRVRKPEGQRQLAPAPAGRGLQHGGQMGGADGSGRLRRPGQPRRPPRHLPRQGRPAALAVAAVRLNPR